MLNTNTDSQDSNLDDYQTMEAIERMHPQFTQNQLRWLVANKERYEIAHILRRIGRKLYFHMPSFLIWVDNQES